MIDTPFNPVFEEAHLARWTTTPTGKQNFMLCPEKCEVDIVDIAWWLAAKCRFGGATKRFYSISEHSRYVAALAESENEGDGVWGLLHDAAEGPIFDLPTPYKSLPQFQWVHALESRWMYQILAQLDLGFGTTDGSMLAELEAGAGLDWWMRRAGDLRKPDEIMLCAEALALVPPHPYWDDRVAKAKARGYVIPALNALAGPDDFAFAPYGVRGEVILFLRAYCDYTGRDWPQGAP